MSVAAAHEVGGARQAFGRGDVGAAAQKQRDLRSLGTAALLRCERL
ncbi:MAG TPA: hypothetical protein VHN20_08825 [Beijerinckiaceae bacterium]|nr:hypothetical protein [Beijerinckiaceae bacterium]